VVNEHLIREGGHDVANAPVIGVVVETGCRFHASLSFPEVVDAGLVVTRLGTSSVAYGIGLFRHGDDDPAATGRFVHVWVDRRTQRPVPVPPAIRAALAPLCEDTAT
jgi:acyl-CoA thioester hydrolase